MSLALVNREANDNHFGEIIQPILRGETPSSRLAAFHPRGYHSAVVWLIKTLRIETNARQIVCAQMLNAVIGFLTILVIHLFLIELNFSVPVLRGTLLLLALNPGLISINAQATNDTFVIFFSVIATVGATWFFREEAAGSIRSWAWLAISVAATAAAVESKGNGLAIGCLFAAYAFLKVMLGAFRKKSRVGQIPAFLLFSVAILVVVSKNPVYFRHPAYRQFFTADVAVVGLFFHKPRRLSWASPEGKKLLAGTFFSFPLVDLVTQPANKTYTRESWNGRVLPLKHMYSYWGQMYGNAVFTRFQQWPPSWKQGGPRILVLGRTLILLNLVPLIVLMAGLILMARWFVVPGREENAGTERLLFLVSATCIAAGGRYYMVYPAPAFAKFIYLAPFLAAAAVALAVGQRYVRERLPASATRVLTSSFYVIALLDVADVSWLIIRLHAAA